MLPRSSMPRAWALGAAAVVAGCTSTDGLDAWPATLVVRSAVSQPALTGYAVNQPPSVRLLDADGEPVAGARVTFTVTAGGGSVAGGVATTGSDGVATVGGWTVAAGANQITAAIPAPFRVASVTFSATGLAPAYQIDLEYITPVEPGRRAVFDAAVARWERLIYGDLPDVTISGVPPEACLGNGSAANRTVDDLLILVVFDSIDGPGGILGAAGPCIIRSAGLLPIVGIMLFDTADVATLEQEGSFGEVILHEMAHVLGFGSLWDPQLLNLLAGGGGSDPFFTGAQGRGAFDRSGGTAYTASPKVPVENEGGPGTRDSHWRESVFRTELMTGFLSTGGPNPLSVVSVAAMEDEGYRMSYAAADVYGLLAAAALRAPAEAEGRMIPLGDDVLPLPIYMLNQRGQVTAVYRPEGP